MKLLRVGNIGDEKPALLYEGKIKSLEEHILDLDPTTTNFNTLDKLKKIIENRELLTKNYLLSEILFEIKNKEDE